MSELKVNTISNAAGTNAISIDSSGNVTLAAGFVPQTAMGRRNLIINGAMQVAQRGTSFSSVSSAGNYYLDRWIFSVGALGAATISQSTDAPSGFSKSLKYQCTTAEASPASGDYIIIVHRFEGQDLQHLNKGASDAKSVTVSFWVKSNKTGAFQVNLYDSDNTRIIGSNVTINASATWEYKTITFAGDTSGALNDDNARSLDLEMWLDAGTDFTTGATPTSWEASATADRAAGTTLAIGDSTSNYFQITGVQLEVGSVATPFEHRSYGEELALCQRYYWKGELSSGPTYLNTGTNIPLGNGFMLPVTMRSIPTGSVVSNEHSQNSNSGTLSELSVDGGRYMCNMSTGTGTVSRTDICSMDAEL